LQGDGKNAKTTPGGQTDVSLGLLRAINRG
jgi:hypothetical protein